MSISKREYSFLAQKLSPPSPSYKNYPLAFLIGGLICCVGQALTDIFSKTAGMDIDDARTCTSVTLVGISAVLTALGMYQKLAKRAGAGTLVPITGFANAVVSPAIEFHSEGAIFGTGAKMFIIAGPVIVFGTLASFIYGLVLWIAGKI